MTYPQKRQSQPLLSTPHIMAVCESYGQFARTPKLRRRAWPRVRATLSTHARAVIEQQAARDPFALLVEPTNSDVPSTQDFAHV